MTAYSFMISIPDSRQVCLLHHGSCIITFWPCHCSASWDWDGGGGGGGLVPWGLEGMGKRESRLWGYSQNNWGRRKYRKVGALVIVAVGVQSRTFNLCKFVSKVKENTWVLSALVYHLSGTTYLSCNKPKFRVLFFYFTLSLLNFFSPWLLLQVAIIRLIGYRLLFEKFSSKMLYIPLEWSGFFSDVKKSGLIQLFSNLISFCAF